MKPPLPLLLLAALTTGAADAPARPQAAGSGPSSLYNPYERPRNGPPLTDVFNKAAPEWIAKKLREPGHHPAARMPDFRFSEEEALAVMAYLKSVAGPAPAGPDWPAWTRLTLDEMEADADIDAMLETSGRGQAVWSNARCSICHASNGPGGELIGGFVDLRVGGIDLQIAGTKLRRNWLYNWIRDPKDHFPDTLMPRFRLAESEIADLVEYVLRDDAFRTFDDEAEGGAPRDWSALDDADRAAAGRRLIELGRCTTCHEIAGIPDFLARPPAPAEPPAGTMEHLAWDARCLTCHSLDGRGGTYAPDLGNEGSRLRGDWLRDFLHKPDTVRPLSQQMPELKLAPEEIETIVSYMTERRLDPAVPGDIPGPAITAADVEAGRELFVSRGCRSCHVMGEELGGAIGPRLDGVAERLRPGWVWQHLRKPDAINRFTAEPDYGLSDDEARLLAAYLTGANR